MTHVRPWSTIDSIQLKYDIIMIDIFVNINSRQLATWSKLRIFQSSDLNVKCDCYFRFVQSDLDFWYSYCFDPMFIQDFSSFCFFVMFDLVVVWSLPNCIGFQWILHDCMPICGGISVFYFFLVFCTYFFFYNKLVISTTEVQWDLYCCWEAKL